MQRDSRDDFATTMEKETKADTKDSDASLSTREAASSDDLAFTAVAVGPGHTLNASENDTLQTATVVATLSPDTAMDMATSIPGSTLDKMSAHREQTAPSSTPGHSQASTSAALPETGEEILPTSAIPSGKHASTQDALASDTASSSKTDLSLKPSTHSADPSRSANSTATAEEALLVKPQSGSAQAATDVNNPPLLASQTATNGQTDSPATPAKTDQTIRHAEELDIKVKTEAGSETIKFTETIKTSTKLSQIPAATVSDVSTPAQTLSSTFSVSSLTPLSSSGSPLLQTSFQAVNTSPVMVTLDKIPNAVVTVALSAKSATLQIDPPELGRIQLDYQFDTQGRTVITLTPESDAARAALLDRMAVITAALEQGSNGSVDVTLADARDFGAAYGQASQEDGSSSDQDNPSGPATPSINLELQSSGSIHTLSGEADRLHIRV